MSNLINIGAMSMTSQEISDLVESRHDSVKRTIDRLANQGVISLPPLVEVKVQRERREETVNAYQFTGEQGKRDSIIVVAQLSPEFTARLVDRWQELEAKQGQQALNPANLSRLQLIEMAMQAEQERLVLETKVEEMAPKVAVHDRIADATGLLTLRETATTLGMPERKFILWMQQHNWLYRRPGRGTLLGYAERIKQGYLDHKVTLIRNERTGEDETRESVRVTPLGLTVLARRLSKEGRRAEVPVGMLASVVSQGVRTQGVA